MELEADDNNVIINKKLVLTNISTVTELDDPFAGVIDIYEVHGKQPVIQEKVVEKKVIQKKIIEKKVIQKSKHDNKKNLPTIKYDKHNKLDYEEEEYYKEEDYSNYDY